jgi:glycerol-3-phosphate dehydrogenase (NAD(P)+)
MNGKQNLQLLVVGWATAITKCYVNLSEVSWYMRNETAIAHLKKTQTQS